MKRCSLFSSISMRILGSTLLILALCTTGTPAAMAEQNHSLSAYNTEQPITLPRSFPDKADKGYILFLEPPMAMLNGVRILVSPGSRIKDQHNRMLVSAQLAGKEFHVMYTRDATQQIGDIWLLSEFEAQHAVSPKQKRDLQLRYMGIDPTHKIDPLTPYNQLPKFSH